MQGSSETATPEVEKSFRQWPRIPRGNGRFDSGGDASLASFADGTRVGDHQRFESPL